MDQSEKYRIIEGYILTVIRRIIPGDYNRLSDIRVETLTALGINFQTAAILPPTNLFQDIVHGGKAARKTIEAVVDAEGSWVFALTHKGGSATTDLQMALFTKEPHSVVMKMLDSGGLKAPLIVLAAKGGHFLILNGASLKSLARSADAAYVE